MEFIELLLTYIILFNMKIIDEIIIVNIFNFTYKKIEHKNFNFMLTKFTQILKKLIIYKNINKAQK